MPVRILVTQGTTADCTQVGRLIEGLMQIIYWQIAAMTVMPFIIEQTEKQGIGVVIPLKKNRKTQRHYDQRCINLGILSKMLFFISKSGVATRYAKNTSSFLATVQIRCIALWVGIL
ncbi:transposase [Nitrosomonas mobilis]|uniref:Transposase n=1 Tax=Nitrosomonas mobilis TaxID=51642 RepID=A0A1G5SDH0_9PROT|nr:transposase [Nitrosomonas mobilis]